MHLVVGSGLCGSVMAERIAAVRNEPVLVVDRRTHIGGNVFDYRDENGITVHKYGPHGFHTNNSAVWDYLSRFTRWTPYAHRVEAFVDGRRVPLPINFNTLDALFTESAAGELSTMLAEEFGHAGEVPLSALRERKRCRELADYIHEKIFRNYTLKQWGMAPEAMDAGVIDRLPVVTGRDNRYHRDRHQGIPADGYAAMVKAMLSSPRIAVELGREFRREEAGRFDSVVYTGMIDEYFGFSLGRLPYRSLRFAAATVEREFFQSVPQVNYPNDFDFTRIVEYKHFLGERSPRTTVVYEYPLPHVHGENDPYYPVLNGANRGLYAGYARLGAGETGTAFVGRLAEYKYYNMDQAVESALAAFERLNAGGFFGK